MSNTLTCFDYLASPEKNPPAAVTVLFGNEPFLKQLVQAELRKTRQGSSPEELFTAYDCEDHCPDFRDVVDELSSASLFGGGSASLVVLRRGDDFVSKNRDKLEAYVNRPKKSGVLLLEVNEWAANTRLYKAVDGAANQSCLQIECRPPMRPVGNKKELDETAVTKWVISRGRENHGLTVLREAAELLVQFSGPVYGMLDQDLAKLALFVKKGEKVSPELVQEVVGGWRSQTVFEVVEAALDGNTKEALFHLDRFLQSGEHPLALFGGISWTLRRYAAATRIYQQQLRKGERPPLRTVLTQAGFFDRQGGKSGELAKAEDRLKNLGRHRGAELYGWLIEVDVALKGSHSSEDRGRFILEQLLLKISKK